MKEQNPVKRGTSLEFIKKFPKRVGTNNGNRSGKKCNLGYNTI
jgi:hypothetical protein